MPQHGLGQGIQVRDCIQPFRGILTAVKITAQRQAVGAAACKQIIRMAQDIVNAGFFAIIPQKRAV